MSIKAVVFDYGQVISLPQDPLVVERLADRAGVEKEKFASVLWSLRGEWDRGVISGREYYGKILSAFSVIADEAAIDDMVEMDLASWQIINPGTVALVEDVKKAGLIFGILSNMPHEFLDRARKNIPVFSLPDVGLFSCEVNLIKPEEAIYRKLLSLTGVESGELVFFDDNYENVRSAASFGIKALLWKNPEYARLELSRLGVIL